VYKKIGVKLSWYVCKLRFVNTEMLKGLCIKR
jgi:hypothetical protein